MNTTMQITKAKISDYKLSLNKVTRFACRINRKFGIQSMDGGEPEALYDSFKELKTAFKYMVEWGLIG